MDLCIGYGTILSWRRLPYGHDSAGLQLRRCLSMGHILNLLIPSISLMRGWSKKRLVAASATAVAVSAWITFSITFSITFCITFRITFTPCYQWDERQHLSKHEIGDTRHKHRNTYKWSHPLLSAKWCSAFAQASWHRHSDTDYAFQTRLLADPWRPLAGDNAHCWWFSMHAMSINPPQWEHMRSVHWKGMVSG